MTPELIGLHNIGTCMALVGALVIVLGEAIDPVLDWLAWAREDALHYRDCVVLLACLGVLWLIDRDAVEGPYE